MTYLTRLFQLRFFLFSLVRNDLNNRYRRSFLGIAWSLVRPVGMTAVLCVVFKHLLNEDLAFYAPWLFISLALWQFLLEALVTGCSTFTQGAPYIRQQPLPLALFPLRTVMVAGFQTIIALVMGIIVWWCFNPDKPPSVLMMLSLVPGLVLVFFLGVCFAIIAGAFHTHFPDTQHLLEIVLQGLYFLTPVIYTPEKIPNQIRGFVRYNPFTAVLDVIRQPIIYQRLPDGFTWLMALSFLAFTAMFAWVIMRRVERELVFWV